MSCQYNFSQFSVTGDCENNSSGGFTLYLSSTSEPMSITWLLPNPWPPGIGGPQVETPIYNGTYTYLGIPAGTYVFTVNDSCGSPTATTENNRETISITISSGSSCVNITDVVNTTCGNSDGSLLATVQNTNGAVNIKLYLEDNDGRVVPLPQPPGQEDITFIREVEIDNDNYLFDNLPYGKYYVIADDGGGCTGRSESVIILPSVGVNFGTYIVNDADCGNVETGVGKIFITGLTGTGPYTYRWEGVGTTLDYLVNTEQPLTGTSITGLTAGFYQATVTDSNGCSFSVISQVIEKLPVSLGSVSTSPPTCFDSNGKITVQVLNGTPPYRFSIPSISFTDISYSQTYVFSGLPGGNYTIVITDAALCSVSTTTQINQSNSFALGPVTIIPPTCGNSNGSISIGLVGNTNSSSYLYSLSGANGVTFSSVTSTNNTFSNLLPQNYFLTITDNICTYTQLINLSSNSLFTISTQTSGATCGNNNGSVTITKSTGGTSTFSYWIEDVDGNNDQTLDNTPLSSCTFYNLAPGSYIAYVSDKNRCQEQTFFEISNSEPVNFILIPTDSTNGSNGQIIANIYQGTPPFTLTWSSNVNGQTGTTVTNLSAGTYSLIVQDSAGCVQSNTVTLSGTYNATNFSLFNVCNSVISSTGQFTERSLSKMLVEGYIDLTSGCTNCLMNSAIFSAVTTVAGTGFSQSFYTATTLNDVPSESNWATTVQNLLSGITGVGTVTVNTTENTITLDTSCEESTNALANQNITVELKIVYDIDCESC
jgi:hypothetical protein